MAEENAFEFQIHYYLNKDGLHQMDARVLNDCERQLLDALDTLKAFTGEFDIETGPKKEGGLIEILGIPAITIIGYETVKNLLNALIQKFFSSTQTKLANSKDKIELIEKAKNGTLTKEEAELLIDDKKVRKCASNYFKSLDKAKEVTSVDASIRTNEASEPFSTAKIVRADFTKKILSDTTIEDKTETAGVTIRILSPVLQKGHGQVWRGFYSGKPVDFKVQDKDFLEQVYNDEIKFGTNTVITCTLVKSIKHKIENGEETEAKTEYAVKDITQWADDYILQNYTKRYKKQKSDEKQPNLFPDIYGKAKK